MDLHHLNLPSEQTTFLKRVLYHSLLNHSLRYGCGVDDWGSDSRACSRKNYVCFRYLSTFYRSQLQALLLYDSQDNLYFEKLLSVSVFYRKITQTKALTISSFKLSLDFYCISIKEEFGLHNCVKAFEMCFQDVNACN